MFRNLNTFFTAILFCQFVFISCKAKSKATDKVTVARMDGTDTILVQFMHHFNDTLPLPENYVNDYEDVFTDNQEDSLNSIIASFDKQTSNQIAVVSIDTTMTTKENFEALTLKLAKAWGVGQKDKNNGILIGISKGYRKIRIQNGLGIEKILSDSATKEIIDTGFIPSFKKADYFQGTLNGVNNLIQKLNTIQQ
ncbi:TPM domain-containing protein [Ferruginibacter sp. SUN106]|uniref:TPM domain-containing protein n=1 Tax=Ferruginibacter sp. SUN106 TaxID=2978348 RepID=UPI003D366607